MAEIKNTSITRTGSEYITTVKIFDDPEDNVDSVGVEILDDIGGDTGQTPTPSPTDLTLLPKMNNSSGNRQFVNKDLNFLNGAGEKMNLLVRTTMYGAVDPDGNPTMIGDSVESYVTVKLDKTALVKSVTIKQLDDINFRLEVITDDPHKTVNEIEVTLIDAIGNPVTNPQPIQLNAPDKTGKEYTFRFDTLNFADTTFVVGLSYFLIIDLYNIDGSGEKDQVGVSLQDVVVQGMD